MDSLKLSDLVLGLWGTKKVGEARRTLTDSRRPRDIITGRAQGMAQKPTSRGSS